MHKKDDRFLFFNLYFFQVCSAQGWSLQHLNFFSFLAADGVEEIKPIRINDSLLTYYYISSGKEPALPWLGPFFAGFDFFIY